MLASMFSLGWDRDERPAGAVCLRGHVRGSLNIRRRPRAVILDRLTAVGAARLVLANGHR
jgi:hypothetical protein